MNYINQISAAFRGKSNTPVVLGAIASGITLGLTTYALLNTEKGKVVGRKLIDFTRDIFQGSTDKQKAISKTKLGNLVDDVRVHVKQNADGLMGGFGTDHSPSSIHVAQTPSSAWKKARTSPIPQSKPLVK